MYLSSANRHLLISLIAGLAGAVAVGGAQAAPFNPDNLPAPDVAGVQAACGSVMVLEPGEAQAVGCFQSLSRSLVRMHAAQGLDAARASCGAQGLQPATGDFAVCMVQRGSDSERAPARVALIQNITVPGGRRSFLSASNGDRRRREALACAALGFDPAGGAFDSCVADLAATMFQLDNPQN